MSEQEAVFETRRFRVLGDGAALPASQNSGPNTAPEHVKQLPASFATNDIRTTKYTTKPWRLDFFVWKILWEQFQRKANLYFFVIGLIQMVPGVSPTGKFTTMATLAVVLSFSAAKSLYEDLQRFRKDSQVNAQRAFVVRRGDPGVPFVPAQDPEKDPLTVEMRKKGIHVPTTVPVGGAGKLQNSTGDAFADGYTEWQDVPYSEVRVGDLVFISNIADDNGDRMNEIPCDVIMLASSDPEGLAYVETANLDGETNLKPRRALDTTKLPEGILEIDSASAMAEKVAGAVVECEAPNNSLYTFTGSANGFPENLAAKRRRPSLSHAEEVDDEAGGVRFGPDQMLYRGCKLRKVHWALGIVVFTGPETKIMMNARKPPHKSSRVENLVNWLLLFVLALQALLIVISAVGGYLIANANRWYLADQATLSVTDFLLSILTFLILYNNFIPISLYVSLEFIKFIQGMFMAQDLCMYYEPRDMPANARTTDLNEELGQVRHVFSDKTGTLTCNVMTFMKFCVGGCKYGEGVTEIGRAAAKRRGIDVVDTRPPEVLRSELPFYDPRVMDDLWLGLEHADQIRSLFTALAVCHTVVVDSEKYEAESPDEEALVKFAAMMGFKFVNRTTTQLTIEIHGTPNVYEILDVIEFNSDRKRMSLLVRVPDTKAVKIITKGADNVMFGVLQHGTDTKETESALGDFGEEGLRTLVLAERTLDADFATQWLKDYKNARAIIGNDDGKAAKMAALALQVECEMTLIGSTAIEDRLQNGVPTTIDALRTAEIKVWMLTGDKLETAINIGFACALLHDAMIQKELTGDMSDIELDAALVSLVAEVEKAEAAKKVDDERKEKEKKKDQAAIEEAARKRKHANEAPESPSTFDVQSFGEPSSTRVTTGGRVEFGDRSSSIAMDSDGNPIIMTDAAIVIDGKALEKVLESDHLKEVFVNATVKCSSVVCCRVSPKQKADVVELVRIREPDTVTLSIGDGANDVPMIQAAHVGIGISGMEGQQAANSSDYSIGQFRYLHRLLMVHGRVNYYRISLVIKYFFYKNAALVLTQFWFACFNLFTGQSLYEQWTLAMFNPVFTALPVVVIGILDRDVLNTDNIHAAPALYKPGLTDGHLNKTLFVTWILTAVWHSAVMFFACVFAWQFAIGKDGYTHSLDGVGLTMYACLIFVVNAKIALHTSSFTWITHAAVWLSIIALPVFEVIYGALPPSFTTTAYNIVPNVAMQLGPWLVFAFTVAVALGVDSIVQYGRVRLLPWAYMSVLAIVQLKDSLDPRASIVEPQEMRHPDGIVIRDDHAAAALARRGGNETMMRLFKTYDGDKEAFNPEQDLLMSFVDPQLEDEFRDAHFGSLSRYKLGFGLSAVASLLLVGVAVTNSDAKTAEVVGWAVLCGMSWLCFILLLVCNLRLKAHLHILMLALLFVGFSGMSAANFSASQREPDTHPVTLGLILLGLFVVIRPPMAQALQYVAVALVAFVGWYQVFRVKPWDGVDIMVRIMELVVVACTSLIALAVSERFLRQMFLSQKKLNATSAAASREEERSLLLLGNVLPAAVVSEMRVNKRNLSDFSVKYEAASLLNSDVVQFTKFSSSKEPHIVVEMLNKMFTKFDANAKATGVEKIKTIGDAYVCAAGIPVPDAKHMKKIVAMGAAMLVSVRDLCREGLASLPDLDVRIRVGAACGPVQAGVLGIEKVAYDVFGKTALEAEAMEAGGKPSRLRVSKELYEGTRGEYKYETVLPESPGAGGPQYYLCDFLGESLNGHGGSGFLLTADSSTTTDMQMRQVVQLFPATIPVNSLNREDIYGFLADEDVDRQEILAMYANMNTNNSIVTLEFEHELLESQFRGYLRIVAHSRFFSEAAQAAFFFGVSFLLICLDVTDGVTHWGTILFLICSLVHLTAAIVFQIYKNRRKMPWWKWWRGRTKKHKSARRRSTQYEDPAMAASGANDSSGANGVMSRSVNGLDQTTRSFTSDRRKSKMSPTNNGRPQSRGPLGRRSVDPSSRLAAGPSETKRKKKSVISAGLMLGKQDGGDTSSSSSSDDDVFSARTMTDIDAAKNRSSTNQSPVNPPSTATGGGSNSPSSSAKSPSPNGPTMIQVPSQSALLGKSSSASAATLPPAALAANKSNENNNGDGGGANVGGAAGAASRGDSGELASRTAASASEGDAHRSGNESPQDISVRSNTAAIFRRGTGSMNNASGVGRSVGSNSVPRIDADSTSTSSEDAEDHLTRPQTALEETMNRSMSPPRIRGGTGSPAAPAIVHPAPGNHINLPGAPVRRIVDTASPRQNSNARSMTQSRNGDGSKGQQEMHTIDKAGAAGHTADAADDADDHDRRDQDATPPPQSMDEPSMCSPIRAWATVSAILAIVLPIGLMTMILRERTGSSKISVFVVLASNVYVVSFFHIRLWAKVAVSVLHLVLMAASFFYLTAVEGSFGLTRDGGDFAAIVMNYLLCLLAVYSTELSVRQSFSAAKRVVYQNAEVTAAVHLCDKLLNNVLPSSIVARLKANPEKAIVDEVPEASVLFLYTKGLQPSEEDASSASSARDTGDVVSEMNEFLWLVDSLCLYHGVEKIKTTPFLVVSGCPEPIHDHARRLVLLARDIMYYAEKYNSRRSANVSVRAGIHTGKVTAGVLGSTKFLYDVFGDTVNFASRLTSSAAFGTVQLSEVTRRVVDHEFNCISRGRIELKGKGEQDIFMLDLVCPGLRSVPVMDLTQDDQMPPALADVFTGSSFAATNAATGSSHGLFVKSPTQATLMSDGTGLNVAGAGVSLTSAQGSEMSPGSAAALHSQMSLLHVYSLPTDALQAGSGHLGHHSGSAQRLTASANASASGFGSSVMVQRGKRNRVFANIRSGPRDLEGSTSFDSKNITPSASAQSPGFASAHFGSDRAGSMSSSQQRVGSHAWEVGSTSGRDQLHPRHGLRSNRSSISQGIPSTTSHEGSDLEGVPSRSGGLAASPGRPAPVPIPGSPPSMTVESPSPLGHQRGHGHPNAVPE